MKISKVLCFLVVMFVLPLAVFADELDPSMIGSININYKYGDTSIPGGIVNLYQVGDLNVDGTYTFIEGIENVNVENISSSELNDISKKINDYIISSDIEIEKTCNTNFEGMCTLSDLPVGIYLINVSSVKIDDTVYSSLPTLITVPTSDEINFTMNYNPDIYIKVESKIEKEDITVPTVPERKPYTPNTVDRIIFYTLLLSISVIIILIAIILIKKGVNEKNEKNK